MFWTEMKSFFEVMPLVAAILWILFLVLLVLFVKAANVIRKIKNKLKPKLFTIKM